MKHRVITIIFLLVVNASTYAQDSNNTFCEWLGNAANVVAQNRDNGIKEYDLIKKYLDQSISYGEQSVVIPLIDRVYNFENNLDPDEVAFAERQQCEIAMVISKSKLSK